MQGQQPIRQADQQILQQPASIVIKMTDGIQQITPVGKFRIDKNLFVMDRKCDVKMRALCDGEFDLFVR